MGLRDGVPVFAAVLFGLVASRGAEAAVEITMERTSPNNETSTDTIYMTPDAMKTDMSRNQMIFNASTGSLLMVNKEKQTYMDLSDMGKQMAAAQAQMEANMKDLPEAQRKQMEAMMGKMGAPQGADSGPTYQKTGSATVGAWSCETYHVTYSTGMTSDQCIAKASDVGVTATDMAALEKLSDQMMKMMPMAAQRGGGMNFGAQAKAIGYEGVPVQVTTYRDGAVIGKTTLKSVAHDPIAPSAFDVPAGYVKQKSPDLGMGAADRPGK